MTGWRNGLRSYYAVDIALLDRIKIYQINKLVFYRVLNLEEEFTLDKGKNLVMLFGILKNR